MEWLILDGQLRGAEGALFGADNRSFRYGDGVFETMLVQHFRIRNSKAHGQRLLASLALLGFDVPRHFNWVYLEGEINRLVTKHHLPLARVRLTVFRADGGLYDPADNRPHFLVQCWPLQEQVLELNSNGMDIGIFPDARKSTDLFSALKTNNALTYVMAAKYAKAQKWNEALVLNSRGYVADSCLANVFYFKGEVLHTPAPGEGAVAGTMAQALLQYCDTHGIRTVQEPVTVADLEKADEVLLTNAIYGLRWVKQLHHCSFGNDRIAALQRPFLDYLNHI
jgi:branched-chain amino acid aminotransferase